ncbi:MAG: GYD domain-containing protein [Halobacteriaceae archaeon]
MVQRADFTTFISLLRLDEPNVQNVQELADAWGTIRRELDEVGVDVQEAFAALGEVDFVVIYEAPNGDAAFQADVVMERHGFNVQTLEATPTDRFADLVADV